MSKLNVDQIEANGTNSNVKVVGKGVGGACEIKGATNDGTLQLNCSAQSHGVKLKAPSDSAGQNYTMILPDNQIATNKLLKVKSVTGSGESAVGQLEFADEPNVDLTTLNASNITTGTIPSDRFPSDIDADKGSVFQFVAKSTTNATHSFIQFSLDGTSIYKIIGKDIRMNNNGPMLISFPSLGSLYYRTEYSNQAGGYSHVRTTENGVTYATLYYDQSGTQPSSMYNFSAEVGTDAEYVYVYLRGFGQEAVPTYTKTYAFARTASDLTNIRFQVDGSTFAANSEFLLYKYKT